MRLSIRNLGKIREADIVINGVTVIAAPNDTGKSTIGKAAFALFESFGDFPGQVRADLENAIRIAMWNKVPREDGTEQMIGAVMLAKYLADALPIADSEVSERALIEALNKSVEPSQNPENTEVHLSQDVVRLPQEEWASSATLVAQWLLGESPEAAACRAAILRLYEVSDADRAIALTNRTFNVVFNNQIAGRFPYMRKSQDAGTPARTSVRLSTENHEHGEQDREAVFVRDRCVQAGPATDEYRHVFIVDDPNIVERFSPNPPRHGKAGDYRDELLTTVAAALGRERESLSSNLTESILAKKDIAAIMELIEKSFGGHVEQGDRGPVMIKDGIGESIAIGNASLGSKAIMLLRFLIEHTIVKSGDVLVLDEPEIHLHPEWQITYARALVLIAKRLGIRMIVTTHSPYFLKALAAYSGVEDFAEGMRYYTADMNDDGSNTFREVPAAEVGDLYAAMAKPLRTIDDDVFASLKSEQR